MGIYPIGSFVLLNNGVLARIFEVRASAPLRPRIQVLVDAQKNVFKAGEGTIIDLLTEKNLYITKAIDSREVTGLYA